MTASQLPAMIITATSLVIIAYFSRNVLKTVDILYKPKVDPWIRDRQKSMRNMASSCQGNQESASCKIKSYEKGFKAGPMDKAIEDDEKFLEFLQQELEMIQKIREAKLLSQLEERDAFRYGEVKERKKMSTEYDLGTCSPFQIFLHRDEL